MTNINWGLLQGTDIGGAFNQGMQQGQQRRQEQATDDALRALIANPNDPNVVNALAKYDPRMALQVQGQQQGRQQAGMVSQLRQRAAQGDPDATAQLAGVDWDSYRQLSADQREQAKQGWATIGEAARYADTPEKWDAVVDQMAAQDPSLSKYRGQFGSRLGFIALAGKMQEHLTSQQPSYQVVPEGGMLVNTRDPAALAQVGAGQPAQAPQGAPAATEDEAAAIIAQGQRDKIISPEDFARVEAALGPQGQGAAREWLRKQGIDIGKVIGGKRYVQRGGEWYEAN